MPELLAFGGRTYSAGELEVMRLVARAVRREPELLGPRPARRTGLPAVDIACLEDAGSGCLGRLERRTAATQPAIHRQQRPISDPAMGTQRGIGQQDSGAERAA